MARIQNLKPLGVRGGERLNDLGSETRSSPDSLAARACGFAFYFPDPVGSVLA
jgi:hypothetical protein